MNPRSLKKRLAEFYSKASLIRKTSTPSRSMSYMLNRSAVKEKQIVSQLDLNSMAIADIGGADGKFIFWLSDNKKISGDTEAWLIDLSPDYLERAQSSYNLKYKGKFKFSSLLQDAGEISFSSKFNVIFFRNIFEHMYFPSKVLESLHRALKPGGLLFITTPNGRRINELTKKIIPRRIMRFLKRKIGTDAPQVLNLEDNLDIKEHFHEYSLQELENILARNKFRIISREYSTIPHLVPSLCDRFDFLFRAQNVIINILNFLKLNRFFCFEFIILAEKSEIL